MDIISVKRSPYLLSTILIGLLLISTNAACAPALTKKQLVSIFSGNTAIGTHIKKKIQIRDYYGKKGRFMSVRGNGNKLKGKWWIGKKYPVICIRYQHKPEKRYCRTIVANDLGSYNKIGSKSGKIYVQYQTIKPGKHTFSTK